jgi:DNA-binding MarR family transcriptional regulator
MSRKKKVSLTKEQLDSLVSRYNKKATLSELGHELGVTTVTVAAYLRPHTTIRSRGRIKGKK